MALHRALDGQGPTPFAFWIGRLCEEFPGKFPSEVIEELDRCPAGLLDEIMEGRAYAHAKWRRDARQTPEQLPSEMEQMVELIEFAIVEEERVHA